MNKNETTEEILQCFDAQGNPTEGQPRSIVKTVPYKYWHGVTCIWVVNNAGQLLCSRRAMDQKANPGKWQSYFGGHVTADHSFTQTAVKELREEAGIIKAEDDLFLIEKKTKPEEKVFLERFVVLYNEKSIDLAKTDGEVMEVQWMDLDDYWKEQADNPAWCSPCRPEHQKSILDWLQTKLKT